MNATKVNIPFRLRAFLLHLSISVVVAVLSLILVFKVWHPGFLAKAVGVTHIFLLLLVIDATLGPLLTLIVAKPGKKSLKTDLIIIAILQLSAYLYGMYHIVEARPVWLAFDTSRFEVVQANSIDYTINKNDILPSYQNITWSSPKWVAVRPAKNDQEKSDRLFYELDSGFAPSMRPTLYTELDDKMWSNIIEAALPLSDLEQYNDKATVYRILSAYSNATAYLPLKSPQVDMSILIDGKNKKIIDIINLRPWI